MTTHLRANAGGDLDVDAFQCAWYGGGEVQGYVRDQLWGLGLIPVL
jgi:hypothetical protein